MPASSDIERTSEGLKCEEGKEHEVLMEEKNKKVNTSSVGTVPRLHLTRRDRAMKCSPRPCPGFHSLRNTHPCEEWR